VLSRLEHDSWHSNHRAANSREIAFIRCKIKKISANLQDNNKKIVSLHPQNHIIKHYDEKNLIYGSRLHSDGDGTGAKP